MNRPAEAEAFLRRAAERLPASPRVSYNYGLLLQSLGKPREAEAALLAALRLEPDNPDFLHAATYHYIERRQWAEAKRYADRLVALSPVQSRRAGPAGTDPPPVVNRAQQVEYCGLRIAN